ncbi:MAG: hypothetical protein M2R45_01802 [Verrucomicrobia subdivision 3 bacterium]|nr:hypothetical protein [Limisphaerales bacterium]MCS1415843.1 hypothetical protein [Limisphaerales bacterium]
MPDVHLNQSIDLFINRVNLGEMEKATCFAYINEINRLVKRWFFHMPHDGFKSPYLHKRGTERDPLAFEYPVSSEFQLCFRYLDFDHLFRQRRVDFNEDIFMYLYRRINTI